MGESCRDLEERTVNLQAMAMEKTRRRGNGRDREKRRLGMRKEKPGEAEAKCQGLAWLVDAGSWRGGFLALGRSHFEMGSEIGISISNGVESFRPASENRQSSLNN